MMGYQLFRDVIEKRILEFLPPIYGDCSITIRKMRKVNEEKVCLSVMPKGGGDVIAACPNIYLDDFYEEFKVCQDMDLILEKIAGYIMEFTGKVPSANVCFDLKGRTDYIIMNVINREKNEELLKTVPHKDFLDLSVIYRIVMTEDESGINTILITDAILKEMGISEEALDDLARQNTKRMYPAVVMTLNGHIYMMTNTIKINGATTILYREAIREFSKKIGKNFFVVPSSIHEVMLIPEKIANLKDLKQTLAEGNRLYSTPKEFLSENIYFYNRKKDTIGMAG